MPFCLPGALWGKHTHLRGVHISQCKNVHITSDRPLPVHKDGESGGIQREFSVTIEKKPLKNHNACVIVAGRYLTKKKLKTDTHGILAIHQEKERQNVE